MTGEFPAQRASNAENVYIWWRHHAHRNLWHVLTCPCPNLWNGLNGIEKPGVKDDFTNNNNHSINMADWYCFWSKIPVWIDNWYMHICYNRRLTLQRTHVWINTRVQIRQLRPMACVHGELEHVCSLVNWVIIGSGSQYLYFCWLIEDFIFRTIVHENFDENYKALIRENSFQSVVLHPPD